MLDDQVAVYVEAPHTDMMSVFWWEGRSEDHVHAICWAITSWGEDLYLEYEEGSDWSLGSDWVVW